MPNQLSKERERTTFAADKKLLREADVFVAKMKKRDKNYTRTTLISEALESYIKKNDNKK